MKKTIGIILIGLMVLASGPAAFARGGCRPGSGRHYHRGRPTTNHHHYYRRSFRRDTFGAVAAGILGTGLIIAAASCRPAPVYYAPAYCPPPPPVYYYPPPVYYVPVYR